MDMPSRQNTEWTCEGCGEPRTGDRKTFGSHAVCEKCFAKLDASTEEDVGMIIAAQSPTAAYAAMLALRTESMWNRIMANKFQKAALRILLRVKGERGELGAEWNDLKEELFAVIREFDAGFDLSRIVAEEE